MGKKKRINRIKQRENELLKRRRNLELRLEELAKEKRKRTISNLKKAGIKNLRLSLHFANFLLPYILTAGLTIGTFKLFKGGLPFKTDDIVKFNRYDLDYQTSENINLNERYVIHDWMSDALPSSTLTIVFPTKINGLYTKITRTYSVESSIALIEAILKNDYEKVEELLSEYDEEIETTNETQEIVEPEIYAEIHFVDKEDTLTYPESKLKNTVITSIESAIVLAVASLVAYIRKFSLKRAINYDKENYKPQSLEDINVEIKITKNRIRTLRRPLQ